VALLAFLFYRGFAVEIIPAFTLRNKDPGKVIFDFPDNSASQREISDFYNHRARVDPLMFSEVLDWFGALKNLRPLKVKQFWMKGGKRKCK